MTAAAMSPEEQLVEDIASFTYDPLGYALYAFPWGEEGTELAHATGPRNWQADAFREIRDHLQNPATRHQPLMLARASGHGIGKSAFISMLINWGMSTCEDCKVVVTANTDNQLRTKTWPEIIKWSNLAITKEWFTCTATAMYSNDPGHDKRWRA
ncbi:terminase, partial [Enterobacter hormaechei]